jgi:Transposase domain (DUF772)
MFKKSDVVTTSGLLLTLESQLGGRKLELLRSPDAWHSVFYQEITSQIDESPFEVLYTKSLTGRPNAPIRQLIGMLILKEGLNWTDEQLYNSCRFDLQVMLSLGLSSLSDDVPTESTYYAFKSKLLAYKELSDIDLLETVFNNLTSAQVIRYKVSGKELRMDSKLFSSNIAQCTRLQLVIGVLQKFYDPHKRDKRALSYLSPEDLAQLEHLAALPAINQTYVLNNEEKSQLLIDLGALLNRIQSSSNKPNKPNEPNNDPPQEEVAHLSHVRRLLSDQFDVVPVDEQAQAVLDNKPLVMPKAASHIKGSVLQSPYDPDAGYRKKESGYKKQRVTGYSTNITETCAKPSQTQPPCLNLITNVQTQTATTPDDTFFQSAIEQSRLVTGQIPEAVWSDGAYNSQENADFTEQQYEQPLTWYVNNIQGVPSDFDFQLDEQGKLHVTDMLTAETQVAHQTPKGVYRINNPPNSKNKWRYLDPAIIRNYDRRKQIKEQPPEIRNRRASVESTIHQVFCTLKGAKSKYRRQDDNHAFVLCRCLWVNCRRIQDYLTQKTHEKLEIAAFFIIKYVQARIGVVFKRILNQKIHKILFGNVKELFHNWSFRSTLIHKTG